MNSDLYFEIFEKFEKAEKRADKIEILRQMETTILSSF